MRSWLDMWDPRHPWTKPDMFEKDLGEYLAVWYGKMDPGKWDESLHATRVDLSEAAFVITEYIHISEWFMDEPWVPEEHGDFYRTQTVEFDPEVVREYFKEAVRTHSGLKMPRDPETTARWVANLGVSYIAYYGGEEDEADILP